MILPRYIEIETSSYCNRNCLWCPNGWTSSRDTQELMEWDLLLDILKNLKRVKYSGWLALHNYNEPLANPRLMNEIAVIREELPFARISIFTNGDYLNTTVLQKMNNLGVVYVRVTLYPHAKQASMPPSLRRAYYWLISRGVHRMADWIEQNARQGPSVKARFGVTHIEVICPDIEKYNWRGGIVPYVLSPQRQKECYMTSHSASIDYRGRMKMCCNVYAEAVDHAEYVIGDLKGSTLLDLWNSPQMQRLRLAHISTDWTLSPICARCTQSLPLLEDEECAYRYNTIMNE